MAAKCGYVDQQLYSPVKSLELIKKIYHKEINANLIHAYSCVCKACIYFLVSALGQDLFERVFSAETLSRNGLGRLRVVLTFCMFLLALAYNAFHATVLFY